jgi:pimeloyl-ACP methyl ester carboxylesterase
VADACAATRFLKTEYDLENVLIWGMCMGGPVAVHASTRLSGPFRPAGMILYSLLADPEDVSLPEYNYRPVAFSTYVRNRLTGSLWNRLKAVVSDKGYRANMLESVVAMARRDNSRLQRMRSEISRVGPLLAQYDGPSLLIYGESDPFWVTFAKRINAGDRLGLSKMKSPPKIALFTDGGHMFQSVQQTSEVIRISVSWATAFRDGQDVCGEREEIRTIFASPARGEGRNHKEDSPLPLGEGDRAAVGEGIAATAIRHRNSERPY